MPRHTDDSHAASRGMVWGVHRTRLHGEMTRNVVAPLPAKAGQAMSLPRKAERKETEKHEESLEKLW